MAKRGTTMRRFPSHFGLAMILRVAACDAVDEHMAGPLDRRANGSLRLGRCMDDD